MATVADITAKLTEVDQAADQVAAKLATLIANQDDPIANQAVVNQAEAIRAKLAAL